MSDYALKICRRITDEAIEGFEGSVLLVSVEKFRAPECRIARIDFAGWRDRSCG